MLTDDDLDRIQLRAKSAAVDALVAEVRRLRGVALPDAELEAIREEVGFLPHSGNPALVRLAAQIETLFAHIAFQSSVIADLRTDLANENQWAAGFRACREMAVEIAKSYVGADGASLADGDAGLIRDGANAAADQIADDIAALTPADYADTGPRKENQQ